MAISDQRQKELEPLSIRVYQQLQAGYPIAAIKGQFDEFDDSDPEEISWILSTGKDRYIGYWKFRAREHTGYSKEFILIGAAGVALYFIITQVFGYWPDFGRGRGMLRFLLLAGLAAVGYGIWAYASDKPPATRTDLDQL